MKRKPRIDRPSLALVASLAIAVVAVVAFSIVRDSQSATDPTLGISFTKPFYTQYRDVTSYQDICVSNPKDGTSIIFSIEGNTYLGSNPDPLRFSGQACTEYTAPGEKGNYPAYVYVNGHLADMTIIRVK
jgi:hypothetical protein